MKVKNISKRLFSFTIPQKIAGFVKPTIWYKFSRLAAMTNSVNLGQGFPDWEPPEFLLDNLNKHISSPSANHQYTRSFGTVKLAEAVANKYNEPFNRKLNPLNEVLISNGATSLLYCTITGFVQPGDEVITLEPFYDCYLPQIEFSGGKLVGVPMIQPKFTNKSEFVNLSKKIIKNEWKIDFEKFRNSLNEKTRMIILNTPHNPTGKILSKEELLEFANILKNYPRVIVVMDEVYEHMIYDDYKTLPRLEELWNRSIAIHSAGKFFSATGIRIGWAIGPEHLIKVVNSVHQFSSFCLYDPLQLAMADSLIDANKPYKGFNNYYEWLRQHYCDKRNYFVENLAKLKNFDLNFYLPEGGYFVIADISNKKNEPKYKFEGEENEENKYHKDFNYLLNMAHEKNLVAIPCSAFYTNENKHFGENLIRFAFCKQTKTLDAALEKLSH